MSRICYQPGFETASSKEHMGAMTNRTVITGTTRINETISCSDRPNQLHQSQLGSLQPLVSIVTVVFNGAKTLEATIQSVAAQTYQNIEFIVIDGGSTDDTCEILAKYNSVIRSWVSERDRGLYDAMNKGLDRCHGEWVLFLGADDTLCTRDTIENVVRQADPTADLVYGDVNMTDGSQFATAFNARLLLRNTIHHQGAFYSKKCFAEFRYDTKYRICADYQLNLRLYQQGARGHKLPFPIALCAVGGVSTTPRNRAASIGEMNQIRAGEVHPVMQLAASTTLAVRQYARRVLLWN
jgi:putative colanic acid biosynthesis glycosyltransferase